MEKRVPAIPALLAACLLAVSCGGGKYKMIVAFDDADSRAFDAAQFTNDVGALIQKNYNQPVDMEIVRESNCLARIKEAPVDFIRMNGADKTRSAVFLVAVRPFENTVTRKTEFQVLLASSLSSADKMQVIDRPVTNPMQVAVSLGEMWATNSLAVSNSWFLWNVKKTKVIAVVDTNSLSWDGSDFLKSVSIFFTRSYKRDFVMDAVTTNGVMAKLRASAQSYIKDRSGDMADFAFLAAVRPFSNVVTERLEFEALFATSLSSTDSVTVFNDTYPDTKDLFAKMDRHFSNRQFVPTNASYYWQESLKVTHRCLEYRPYNEVITSDGYYLLVESVSGIMPDGRLGRTAVSDNGAFNPAQNETCKKLVELLNSRNVMGIFYDDKKNVVRRMVFFEYLTTGDMYTRLMFGPVDRTNYAGMRAQLKDAGIETYPELAQGRDFR